MPANLPRLERRGHAWIAYAAAAWALIFGIFHVVWAYGWYIGLNPEHARDAFANPWFLPYDLVVAGMCFVAVPVALALGLPWGQRFRRRTLLTVAWVGTGLLALRAVASVVQVLYLFLTGGFVWPRISVWEPWFYVGAILFSLDLWYGQRQPARTA